MSLNLGIVGLQGSGKTTLFNAITGSRAQISAYSSADQPNVAVVKVPDPRLDVLATMYHPRKNTPADVQFTDVPGTSAAAKETNSKEPISRQTLGFLSTMEALVLVVRSFENASVPLPEGVDSIDPARDAETFMLEMAFSDLGIIERRLERLKSEIPKLKGAEREAREREQIVLTQIVPTLEAGGTIRDMGLAEDDEKLIRNYGFLTAKYLLVVVNLGENNISAGAEQEAKVRKALGNTSADVVAIPAQLEMEIGQLTQEDGAEFREMMEVGPSRLSEVIGKCYSLLGLISFLTAGDDEVRAWTIRRGTNAQRAAGAIHSDLERGFIRAEVIHYDDLVAAGTMAEGKKRGTVRMEGKTYPVKDGDIINVLFNV